MKGENLLITLDKVTKIYENGTTALKDISLNINKGEFVFIVGTSGSGKSTFMKMLLKEIEPSYGEIKVNDIDINTLTKQEIPFFRRQLGVVFQNFRLLPSKTVFENIAFAMRVVEDTPKNIRRAVPAILAMVGLTHKAKAYPNELSGGEQQRVALARAMVNKPPILLADEPTGNLDPETSWEIMELLQEINDRGTTVVISTHAKEIVDTMKKRVITLQKGVILSDREGGYSYDEY